MSLIEGNTFKSKYIGDEAAEFAILNALTPIILETVNGAIVEIGIGHSTAILARHCKRFKRKQYSIDSSSGKCEFAKHPEIWHDNLIICHQKAYIFIEDFDENPCLVLLDGSHKANTVLEEAEFFLEKMSPNGLMFIHDTCPMIKTYEHKLKEGKEADMYKVRKELEKRDDIDILTWRYGVGMSMILKKEKGLPFYRY